MNRYKKTISLLLSAAIVVSVFPVTTFAEETNTEKEEVVYVNLNTDGTVEEINIVNIFRPDQDGRIIDYGKYQSVRNMTTTDKIDYSGDIAKIHTTAEKIYYEGKMDSIVMPWEIQIRYYLDDKEYSAKEIAGKSGALKITIHITQNNKCQGGFYESYALQASISLDTDKCKNIAAPDATVANVGSSKQLTYTILPGKGADIEITADVSEFEMDRISINGIPLNLNIEVDDEELINQVTELLDVIEQLDDGASQLCDGVSELQDGVQTELKNGVNELTDGAKKLHDGTSNLKEGGASLQNGATDLKDGISALDEGIGSLNNGIEQMQTALGALNQQSPELVKGSFSFGSALAKLQTALNGISFAIEDLTALTDASSAIKTGIDSLVDGITALQGNVSFEAYKVAMMQNGLDVDGLRQRNESAINNLQGMVLNLSSQIEVLKKAGMDTSDLEAQVKMLSDIAILLGADNASIGGTETYLSAVNSNLSALLQGATALQTNYKAFDEKVGELVNKISGFTYQMSELSSAVNALVAEYGKLDSGITVYTEAVAQIVAGYSQIAGGASQLVFGSSALRTGSENLYNGTGELLSGIVEIYNGTGTLKDGAGNLDDGVSGLMTGIAQLYDGTGNLKNGTSAMWEETEGMDTEITDKIDELLETVSGGSFEAESFVSEKNTNIDSVQFVIKTNGVQAEATKEVIFKEAKRLTLWQKFLNLFGLYEEDK